MFAQAQRVKKGDFEEIMKKGKHFNTPFFSVVFNSSEDFRCAVVISKKAAKKAVVRNTNKRRTRHLLKGFEKQFTGTYIVFIKKDISSIEHNVLKQEIEKLVLYFNH